MKLIYQIIFLLTISFFLFSCGNKNSAVDSKNAVVSVKTIPLELSSISQTISFNGNIVYLKKNIVVSPISGYIQKVNVKYGSIVGKNQILFEIQTKENKALNNNNENSFLKIRASSSGMISEIFYNAAGSYVTEGTQLCSIVEDNDLMVQVNVPYEYSSKIKQGNWCVITLPDNKTIKGTVFQSLPIVDQTAQTQQILVKPETSIQLPENLNVIVDFVTETHQNTFVVPKNVVLSNEIQTEYWLMKVIKDSIAIKVPITKGIENDSLVEIFSSQLHKNDLLINDGNYGLEDGSVVKIEK